MTARMKVWQCVGCGRIESNATCIGICHDKPTYIVSAGDYDAIKAELDELRLLLQQIVHTSPRNGEWERAYQAMQERARRALGLVEEPA
jgi:hypothetical protein